MLIHARLVRYFVRKNLFSHPDFTQNKNYADEATTTMYYQLKIEEGIILGRRNSSTPFHLPYGKQPRSVLIFSLTVASEAAAAAALAAVC